MRVPKTTSLGIRPSLPHLSLVSISGVASAACTVAFWVLTVAAVLVPAAVIGRKLLSPDTMLIAGEGENAIQLPLPWAYVLLVAVAAFAYLATSALIFRLLLRIVATLRVGDPFHPLNVRRLHQIGAAFATVTVGVWVGQFLVARFVRGAMAAPSLFDLITPSFAVVIIVVIAEVFREGARLRRESELTI
ncbi:hypothetical protein GCM10009116_25930 [Brevundimonas basaltis]|uniref:DUF2975 domain-containing protein n=1 Tax=Brevundimonas basaltis TaxID=472166 RepID=A0A7W8HYU9_9CAUL|nr:DUF2975 domain-containing protein [Brevundimonas basaltis]MBB5291608.1 hypothetical protein [Brevundimonas basaltis]